MRLIFNLLAVTALTLLSSSCGSSGGGASSASSTTTTVTTATNLSTSSALVVSSSGLSATQLTQYMGAGWNLGNSLESTTGTALQAQGDETSWGNPVVTQQLINAVKAAGFKSIRIPVSWSHFTDATNFVIDPAWMARVDQVVNYALNADMYVIMNEHWDGGWMQPTYAQQSYVNNRLAIMWKQIATHFQYADNRLIFAGSNEVAVTGVFTAPTTENAAVQNSFNQTFVNTVRATGGNNATRYLLVQGYLTNIAFTVASGLIPSDTASKKLLMEVHYYDPYDFTLNTSTSITQWGMNATNPGATETWANESYVDAQFLSMQTNFANNGIGVVLGEFGAINKLTVPGEETYRIYWDQYISKSAVAHQMVPFYWDNGATGNNDMGLFDRTSGNQIYPVEIHDIVSAAN